MLATLLAATVLAAPAFVEGPSYFQGNFEEALAKAKAEKKPILIDFFTEW